jgi:hypothetical protein
LHGVAQVTGEISGHNFRHIASAAHAGLLLRPAICRLFLSLRFQLDGLALGLFLLLAGALLLFALLPSLPVFGEVRKTFAEADEFRPVEGRLGIDQLGHGALAEAVLVHAVDQHLQQYGKLTVGGGCIDAGSSRAREKSLKNFSRSTE